MRLRLHSGAGDLGCGRTREGQHQKHRLHHLKRQPLLGLGLHHKSFTVTDLGLGGLGEGSLKGNIYKLIPTIDTIMVDVIGTHCVFL